jgi:hypothetical protein
MKSSNLIIGFLFILLALFLLMLAMGCSTLNNNQQPVNEQPLQVQVVTNVVVVTNNIYHLHVIEQTNPVPTESNMTGVFIDDFNKVFDNRIQHLPPDKYKHVIVSKGLFYAWELNCVTSFGMGLESLIRTLEIGYQKEMKDKNIPITQEHKNLWNDIYVNIEILDTFANSRQLSKKGIKLRGSSRTIKKFKSLDKGDLDADVFGALGSYIIFTDMELPE